MKIKPLKVNLYIDGIKIKSVKREPGADILHEIFKVKVFGHKEIFNNWFVEVSIKPMQVIANSEKEIDLNCVVYGGINID